MSFSHTRTTRSIRRLVSFAVVVATTGFVLAAVLVTAARFALPLTEVDNRWVAEMLGERLGYRVRLGSASLQLDGRGPRLVVRDLRLFDPDPGPDAGPNPGRSKDVLALDAFEIAIDPLASVRAGVPKITALTLIGSRLAARIDSEGRLQLDGLEALSGRDPRALEFLLTQARVELVVGEILLRDDRPATSRAGLRLTDLHLRLLNNGDRHALAATAALHSIGHPIGHAVASLRRDPGPNRLSLFADLDGPATEPASWNGRVYAGLDAGDLDEILRGNGLPAVSVRSGRIRLESWSRIGAGRLEDALIRVALSGLRVGPVHGESSPSNSGPAEPLKVAHLGAIARVRPRAEGWHLQIGDLAGRIADADVPRLDLDLRLTSEGRPDRLRVRSDPLDLAALASVLSASPWSLPESVAGLIAAKPRGRVEDPILQVDWVAGQPPRWAVRAEGEGLGWDRTGALPGIDGLAVRLRADREGGEARVGSAGLALDLRPLFSEPLALDRLSTRLDWRIDPSGAARISARNLTFENADLAGRARLVLDLSADGSSPLMDLRASFYDGDGSRVRPYLPVGIMHRDLVRWLERAVVSGRVPQADLIFRGPLAAYPFRGHEGRFELLLELENAVLDYLPDWPAIREAAGRLRFLDQSLTIELDRGRILDSRLVQARGEIPEIWGAQGMRIVGETEGPFSDGLRTLTETPLSRDLGRLAGSLEVTGDSQLRLEIDLPFTKQRQLGVAGRLSWPKPATLAIRGTPVELSRLGGEVTFTEKSLASEALEGMLWDRPLSLSIATLKPGVADASATLIKARSRTPATELGRRFPSPAWGLVSGELDWDLDVTIRNRDVRAAALPLDYRLAARLNGLAIDLPAPLGKSASATRDLELVGALVPGSSLRVAGRLGEVAGDLMLDLGASPPPAMRAHVRLGGESAPTPEGEGVFLDGRLADLDLAAWLGRLEALSTGKQAGESPPAPGAAAWFRGADLQVDRLALGGPRLTDVDLLLAPIDSGSSGKGWEVAVRANELAGEIEIPAEEEAPVRVALERLDLLAFQDRPEQGESEPSALPVEEPFRGLPPIDVRIARLSWGDALLGTLQLDLRPDALGLRLPSIRLVGEGLVTAEGEAAWLRSESGGRSEVSLRVESVDSGVLLEALDSQNRLEDAPMQAQLMLGWPGGFGDFELAQALGVLDVEVGSGRLLDVEPGVGRVLGFLNLSALKRRLTMDFTDLYGQGFAFEEMRARIQVAEGKATLDAFTIDGPASKVIVSGSSDLVHQRFEQSVVVEPRIGSSVALASAVAGGPVVGAAVYLVDRIAGNAIDRLGRYRYRVTGPWSNPDVSRVGWDPAVGVDASPAPASGEAPTPPEPNHFLD
ncbi:YhdP family protein [Thiocapsa sp.]|uniref:YhdP family protein n=1 Tax=Thiocapsa sp. TaxID=2024551 RepID=UPI002CF8D844|nr:YhdP family protein [Thiocapsa sp.]HSO83896.1 YhdP family protein [Thiocapsa sp.]